MDQGPIMAALYQAQFLFPIPHPPHARSACLACRFTLSGERKGKSSSHGKGVQGQEVILGVGKDVRSLYSRSSLSLDFMMLDLGFG